MTESVVVYIGRASRRGVLTAVALATLLGTGGCSSVPDAMNPVEWYRGTRDWVAGDDKVQPAKQAQAKPVPGSDKPFPTLTSVPERPAATADAERRTMARSLNADRDAARYTDDQLRRQTAETIAAPPMAQTPPAPAATEDRNAPAAAENQDARAADTRPPEPPQIAPAAPAAEPQQQQRQPEVRSQPLPPEVPPEVRAAEPASGQVASVPRQQDVPAAPPPPPKISPVVTAGQPIPVDPTPAPRPPYTVPPAPPPAVEVAPTDEQTAFVRPNRFSPQFGTGTGPVRAPPRFDPPPAAPGAGSTQGASPRFAPQPGFTQEAPQGFAPSQGFASGGTPVATIYFGTGSSKVGRRGRDAIREAFRAWQSRGGRIRVVGHASSRTRNMDRVSHELANFRVSDERARAVARELIRLGVDPSAIVVEAVSDQQPAFVEVMPAGEAGNRRAEILLEN